MKPSQTVILVLEEQETVEECHLFKNGGDFNSVNNNPGGNLIIKTYRNIILIYLFQLERSVQVRREKEAFHLLTLFQILYQGTVGNIVLNTLFAHILTKFLHCYFLFHAAFSNFFL